MQELILAAIIKIEDEHILEVIYAFITELIGTVNSFAQISSDILAEV